MSSGRVFILRTAAIILDRVAWSTTSTLVTYLVIQHMNFDHPLQVGISSSGRLDEGFASPRYSVIRRATFL